jgi:hypothetical protein
MAHLLSLTDGTTTISLADGSTCFVERYTPKAPDVDAGGRSQAEVWGGEVAPPVYRNVTESMDLFLRSTTSANLQALVRSIEGMLETAHRRQRLRIGARVWLVVQLDGEASGWRSEILTGRFVLDEDGLGWWPNQAVRGQLIIQRRPFFEGAEVELALSTSNQAAATGGRTVVNHDDAGAGDDNWVEIASDQVGGSLPAPVRLQLTNASGGSRSYSTFYLALLADGAAGQTVALEMEAQNATVVSDAGSSGGAYAGFSYTATEAGTVVFPRVYAVTAGLVAAMGGRYVRLLGRFVGLSAPMWASVYLQDASNHTLWWGPEVLVQATAADLRLKDLGVAPLPPVDLGASAGAVKVVVQFRQVLADGETAVCNFDFMQVTPTECLRVLRAYETPVANGGAVVLDEIEDVGYFVLSGVRVAGLAREGARLMVKPGQTQRILVLCDEGGDAMNIGRAFSVRVWYRPRRVTV